MRLLLLLGLAALGCSSRPLYLPDDNGARPTLDGGARDLPAPAFDLAAPCARTSCGGACVDTAVDSNHCGACGHDCGGASCNGGKCAAVTVLDNQSRPYALAINETDVFLRTYGYDISRVSVATGAATVLAQDQPATGGLTIDTTHVYWPNFYEGDIMKVAIAGGVPTRVANGQHHPDAIAVDEQNLYWINTADAAVVKQSLAGGPVAELARLPETSANTTLASDGKSLFWLFDGGYLQRIPVGGGRYEKVLDLYLSGSSFALHDGWIYFSNTAAAAPGIDKVASDGSGHRSLSAREPTSSGGIASDGKFVYYTTWGSFDGTVKRVPVGGGAPEVLAANQREPSAIVVNSKFVYWVEEGGGQQGTLRRIAK